ncbi:MAG: acylphosphatase [Candidatus Micrarchaeota archaeon]
MRDSYFWVIIRGDQIQGVGFREALRSVCLKLGINGFAQNRFDGNVEAFCKTDSGNLEKLDARIKIYLAPKLLIEAPLVEIIPQEGPMILQRFSELDFESFTVKRDSDLREMVWGLQGAGYTFLLVEKKRTINKINGLIHELNFVSDRLQQIKIRKDIPAHRLSHFLLEPPVEEALVRALEEVYLKIQEFNEENHKVGDAENSPAALRKELQEMLGGSNGKDGMIERLKNAKKDV